MKKFRCQSEHTSFLQPKLAKKWCPKLQPIKGPDHLSISCSRAKMTTTSTSSQSTSTTCTRVDPTPPVRSCTKCPNLKAQNNRLINQLRTVEAELTAKKLHVEEVEVENGLLRKRVETLRKKIFRDNKKYSEVIGEEKPESLTAGIKQGIHAVIQKNFPRLGFKK